MFDKILSCTKSLSDQLQSIDIDLAQAADLVIATKSMQKNIIVMTQCGAIFISMQCELHGIEPSLPVKTRPSQTI